MLQETGLNVEARVGVLEGLLAGMHTATVDTQRQLTANRNRLDAIADRVEALVAYLDVHLDACPSLGGAGGRHRDSQ